MRRSVEPSPQKLNEPTALPVVIAPLERRKRPRMGVHWPIRILRPERLDPEETVTHNLSSEGFYFIAKSAFVPGEIRICIVSMPSYDPHGDRLLPMECHVRVVRVEPLAEAGSLGVGCQIEDYRLFARGKRDADGIADRRDARQILSEKLVEGKTRF